MEGMISTLTLLCVVLSGVGAIQVTIPQKSYEFARGDNITLPCSFKPKSPVNSASVVLIAWFVQASEADAAETQILTYYYPQDITDITSTYEGRVSLDVDVTTGKANLRLSSITLADNKNFECRLTILRDDEGTPAATTRLVVLVAPSKPICKIQGKAEYGQNINLTCVSEEGSPAPIYKWESRDVQNIPRIPDPRTTDKGGVLSLFNISKETSGYYICTSSNKIRSATCNITLSVMPPSMNIGSTAGIIAAVVGFLIILIIIIYCCCCRKKNKEDAYVMGVREKTENHDEELERNGESRRIEGQGNKQSYEDSSVKNPDHDHNDRRSDYDDRRSDYDDRRSDYDDRRSDYDDRRSDYNDRRSDYDDRRDRYSDRHERYDDDRRYDDERRYRDRRYDDDDRYDDRKRPPVPNNKPPRRDYDE